MGAGWVVGSPSQALVCATVNVYGQFSVPSTRHVTVREFEILLDIRDRRGNGHEDSGCRGLRPQRLSQERCAQPTCLECLNLSNGRVYQRGLLVDFELGNWGIYKLHIYGYSGSLGGRSKGGKGQGVYLMEPWVCKLNVTHDSGHGGGRGLLEVDMGSMVRRLACREGK